MLLWSLAFNRYVSWHFQQKLALLPITNSYQHTPSVGTKEERPIFFVRQKRIVIDVGLRDDYHYFDVGILVFICFTNMH